MAQPPLIFAAALISFGRPCAAQVAAQQLGFCAPTTIGGDCAHDSQGVQRTCTWSLMVKPNPAA